MLFVDYVTKKFNDTTVLDDITLEFENGVYGLLAPNGAGKTTLMRMLATLSFPTSGEITWNGADIISLDEKYRDILGYLPQKFGYYRNYTPKQFLQYISALKGLDSSYAAQRIETLMDDVGLSDVMNKKMKKFSGGMLQRVGIAQALLNDPRIIIFDEPTAGLDPKERVRFRNMLRQLADNCIVILSTHIVSDIETIADKVVMLKDHKVFCCDTPDNICNMMNGKIFEVAPGANISVPYKSLSERHRSDGTVMRIYSEEPVIGAAPAAADLEDVFLAVYSDEL